MDDQTLLTAGNDKSIALLHRCANEHGFVAAPQERANYHRIWGRDSSIATLGALASGEAELIDAGRRSLATLARYQGPHGEIPSNVDPFSDRVSYGGTAGRVDADLWFIIAASEYIVVTNDTDFFEEIGDNLEQVRRLLGAWEFNTRGLLYIPATGDWADEYLHAGYVLYDQLLYLQAQRSLASLHNMVHGTEDHDLKQKYTRLKHLIQANYWFADDEPEDAVPDDVYHEILYRKGKEAQPKARGPFWLPFFGPGGFGYRFDAFANVLASLLGVANDTQRGKVSGFIEHHIGDGRADLLPAFWPVITPRDEAWDDLQMTFSYSFKNQPYEYHNAGLWPMVTAFHAADLAARGEEAQARRYLLGVHRANAREDEEGEPWSFPEFLHGQSHAPGGTRHLAWNAASAILASKALAGQKPLRCT